MKRITVTICMGSSCFSRGNGKNLPQIQKYIEEHAFPVQIILKGCRCSGKCSDGPNIWVDTEQCPGSIAADLPQFFHTLHTAVTSEETTASTD